MSVLRIAIAAGLLAGLTACNDVSATAPLVSAGGNAVGRASDRICETVTAVATGFGEANVTGFAHSNLDIAIDKMKDELSQKGAKSFSIEARSARCEDFIDFGGAIGREHKCRARARLCGKTA
jgi:hypothetical protein